MDGLSYKARGAAGLVALLAFGAYGFRTGTELWEQPERSLLDVFWRQARYFTYLTTLLAAGVFARFAVLGRAPPGWAAGLALWLATVGAVYHLLLAREMEGLAWWSDHGLHTAVPLAVTLWWLVYGPKAGLRPDHARLWLVWPVIYGAYALLRGEWDGRHPYFFLDPPMIGWPWVAACCLGLCAVFWMAGRALIACAVWIDRRSG